MARGLLEIHGQHAQQALLEPAAQRDALDRFAGIDPAPTRDARRNLRELTDELAGLGGDERELARHMELLEYQLRRSPQSLRSRARMPSWRPRRTLASGGVPVRRCQALDLLTGGGGESADVAAEQIARARSILGSAKVFEEISSRLAALGEELADCAADLRNAAENIEPDHERLAEVRSRRQALSGCAASTAQPSPRSSSSRANARRSSPVARVDRAARTARRADRRGAGHPRTARWRVGRRTPQGCSGAGSGGPIPSGRPGDARCRGGDRRGRRHGYARRATRWRSAGSQQGRRGPLARVASGGELSRVMLALRLVLSGGPPTMVFDEVDAGDRWSGRTRGRRGPGPSRFRTPGTGGDPPRR
ncbi:MAG: hypothetical protein R2789_07290 [Microthrixaceae bacterium]